MPWSLSRSLPAVDDHVDRALLQQELGALEAFGQLLPHVCSITRGRQADQRLGFGDHHVADHREARRDAAIVGSVSTEMNGSLRSARSVRAAVVLAICTSESSPSCMRAPPEAVTQTYGSFCSMATRTPRTKRSPTTDPSSRP